MFWGRTKGPAHLHASAEIAKANCVPFGRERVSAHNMQNGLPHCRTCMLPIGMRRLFHMERNTPDLWIAISSTDVPTKYGLTARTSTTISSTNTMPKGCFAAAHVHWRPFGRRRVQNRNAAIPEPHTSVGIMNSPVSRRPVFRLHVGRLKAVGGTL